MKIDFAKLLGFNTVSDELPDGLDFKDDTFGARLGAKVGDPEDAQVAKTVQFSKLLGFDTVTDEFSKADIDFQNDTFSDKLGAKIGVEETESDARLKRDIDHVATRADGLPIYSFRYLWDDEVHVGVMAQDLLRNETWRPAVVMKEGGTLAVNYAKIGLRMATLVEWRSKGMEALIRETDE